VTLPDISITAACLVQVRYCPSLRSAYATADATSSLKHLCKCFIPTELAVRVLHKHAQQAPTAYFVACRRIPEIPGNEKPPYENGFPNRAYDRLPSSRPRGPRC